MGYNPQSTPHNRNIFNRLLVLIGPTASGKTPVSIQIAEHLNAEIISADSRQVYKLMDIGTAKPAADDLKRVRHYFVDELMPDQEFNSGEFGKRGNEIIGDILHRGKIPIVAGGSGLYVQALVDGFFEGPAADTSIRQDLYHRLKNEGAEVLLDELRKIDSGSAMKMLPSNTRRIVRALEVYKITGVPLSEMQKLKVKINFTPVFAGLRWDRKKLYERINLRADSMIECGLVEEVRQLREQGYSSKLNALQTVGYKEVFDYLDGRIDYGRMVELIKQNTRRYAKRQLTWFRNDERVRWFDVNDKRDFERVALEISEYFDAG